MRRGANCRQSHKPSAYAPSLPTRTASSRTVREGCATWTDRDEWPVVNLKSRGEDSRRARVETRLASRISPASRQLDSIFARRNPVPRSYIQFGEDIYIPQADIYINIYSREAAPVSRPRQLESLKRGAHSTRREFDFESLDFAKTRSCFSVLGN